MNTDKNFCVVVFRSPEEVDLSRSMDIEYVKTLLGKAEIVDGFLSNCSAKGALPSFMNMFTRIVAAVSECRP
jgi:hypothetical protein